MRIPQGGGEEGAAKMSKVKFAFVDVAFVEGGKRRGFQIRTMRSREGQIRARKFFSLVSNIFWGTESAISGPIKRYFRVVLNT